jgi:uncharacterized protein (DUF1800 family)
MVFGMVRLFLPVLAFVATATFAARAWAIEPALTVVEYYNATLNHYFMTADPAEQAGVERGAAGPGWVRTGVRFSAYERGQAVAANSVCRFYSATQNSHFYTADAAECEFVKKDKGWQYEGLVFAVPVPTAQGCAVGTQPVYRVYNNGFGKAVGSNHRFVPDLTLAQAQAKNGEAFEGIVFCTPSGSNAKRADAVRLLNQATFGARFDEIDAVLAQGATAWIDAQIAMPTSKYTALPVPPPNIPSTCRDDYALPVTATSFCIRDNYTMFTPQREFWQQAIQSPDQLRQRVAWAWSQFFVISALEVNRPYGMLDYQQMLRDNAFENFSTLLRKVTLHPSMGSYLDMANNRKRDAAKGIEPNENFAREVIQLFTVGTDELNLDGTKKLDGNGRTIPTYDIDEIRGYAAAFTGWTFPTAPGQTAAENFNPINWAGTMEVREHLHDTDPKELLDGKKTTAGNNATADLDTALASLFNHRNVAPFVSRFMIQKLVTSHPSPQYIERVARVFQDNGQGVRGDVKAVVKAILLDAEARGEQKSDNTFGKLNEPVLLLTQLARAMDARTDGFYFQNQSGGLGQNVFTPPSVFNYFPADYALPTSGITAPEFGIFNSNTTLARINSVYFLLYGTSFTPNQYLHQATGTQFNLTPYTSIAASSDALVDKVAEIVQGTAFSPTIRATIKRAIDAVPATDTTGRARTALYLAFSTQVAQVKR